MDFEMKFLTAFYAVLGGITSVALVAVLIGVGAELLGMLVVVIALFAAMVVLAMSLIGSDKDDTHDVHPV